MKIITTKANNTLKIELIGELDHHAARNAIKKIGQSIDLDLPQKTILNLAGLNFMDSSGIAVIINIFRRMQELSGDFEITDVPTQAGRVISAAGLDKIIKISTEKTLVG